MECNISNKDIKIADSKNNNKHLHTYENVTIKKGIQLVNKTGDINLNNAKKSNEILKKNYVEVNSFVDGEFTIDKTNEYEQIKSCDLEVKKPITEQDVSVFEVTNESIDQNDTYDLEATTNHGIDNFFISNYEAINYVNEQIVNLKSEEIVTCTSDAAYQNVTSDLEATKEGNEQDSSVSYTNEETLKNVEPDSFNTVVDTFKCDVFDDIKTVNTGVEIKDCNSEKEPVICVCELANGDVGSNICDAEASFVNCETFELGCIKIDHDNETADSTVKTLEYHGVECVAESSLDFGVVGVVSVENDAAKCDTTGFIRGSGDIVEALGKNSDNKVEEEVIDIEVEKCTIKIPTNCQDCPKCISEKIIHGYEEIQCTLETKPLGDDSDIYLHVQENLNLKIDEHLNESNSTCLDTENMIDGTKILNFADSYILGEETWDSEMARITESNKFISQSIYDISEPENIPETESCEKDTDHFINKKETTDNSNDEYSIRDKNISEELKNNENKYVSLKSDDLYQGLDFNYQRLRKKSFDSTKNFDIPVVHLKNSEKYDNDESYFQQSENQLVGVSVDLDQTDDQMLQRSSYSCLSRQSKRFKNYLFRARAETEPENQNVKNDVTLYEAGEFENKSVAQSTSRNKSLFSCRYASAFCIIFVVTILVILLVLTMHVKAYNLTCSGTT